MSNDLKFENAVRRAWAAVKSKNSKMEPMLGLDSFPAPRDGKKGEITNWLREWKPLLEILKAVRNISEDDIELWVRDGKLPVLHTDGFDDDDRPRESDEYPLDVVEFLAERKRLSELAKPKPYKNWETMESIQNMCDVSTSEIATWVQQGKLPMLEDKYPPDRVKKLIEEREKFEKISHSH